MHKVVQPLAMTAGSLTFIAYELLALGFGSIAKDEPDSLHPVYWRFGRR